MFGWTEQLFSDWFHILALQQKVLLPIKLLVVIIICLLPNNQNVLLYIIYINNKSVYIVWIFQNFR